MAKLAKVSPGKNFHIHVYGILLNPACCLCLYVGLDLVRDNVSLEVIYDKIYEYFIKEIDAADCGNNARYLRSS